MNHGPEASSAAFSLKQLLTAAAFTPAEKDVLQTVLDPKRRYTLEEAREQLLSFQIKEVN